MISLPGTPADDTALMATESQLQESQKKLADSFGEVERLNVRISKLLETEKMLQEATEKYKTECMAAKYETVHAAADSRFQSERYKVQ